MSNLYRLSLALTVVSVLVAGCGKAKPTATLPPSTATPTITLPSPMATPTTEPTIVTDTLTPTHTPAPPTEPDVAPPSPTAANVDEATPPTSPLLLQKSPQSFPLAPTFQVALGDLDSDGDLDAVFATMGDYNSQVWLNDGNGRFYDSGQALTHQGHGVDIGDLNSDGDLDLFITCAGYSGRNEPSQIYLNDGTGTFTATGQDLGDLNLSGNGAELVDIDADGDLDTVVKYYQAPYKVYLNDGQGQFTKGETSFPDQMELSWGDLDGDGDPDVLAKESDQGYKALLNDGDGAFSEHWQLADPDAYWGYQSLALGDLDGDGDLDALITNGQRGQARPAILLLNDGTGRFTDSGQQLPAVHLAWVGLGDLDGDGHLDALLSILEQPNQVWLNDGQGDLRDSGLRLGEDEAHRISALGDLDDDGDLDLFLANFGFGEYANEVWFNETAPSGESGAGSAQIAFTSERDGNSEIYIMDADGGNPRRLTDHPAYDAWPTWSPDGSQIAFMSDRSGNPDIYVMDADGTNVRQLTHHSANDIWPEWSPDGTRIAFPSRRDGNFEIYVINADGTNLQRLTNTPSAEDFPAWSPDGSRIVFSRTEGDDGTYIMNVDDVEQGSRDERQLLDISVLEPAWSPDGTRIAFGSDHEGFRGIYVMDADGGNLQRLSSTRAGENCPAWSPDGTQIAFASWRDGDGEIYVMDVADVLQGTDGGNLQKLTDNRSVEEFPAWRPTARPPEQAAPGIAVPSDNSLTLGDTWTRPADGMVMVYVPSAEFQMSLAKIRGE